MLCLNFIKKINSRKPKFDNATDACLSLYDHCRIVEEKINLVKKIKIKDKKIVNILLISSSEFQRIKKNLNNGEFNFYKKLKKVKQYSHRLISGFIILNLIKINYFFLILSILVWMTQ